MFSAYSYCRNKLVASGNIKGKGLSLELFGDEGCLTDIEGSTDTQFLVSSNLSVCLVCQNS